MEEEAAEWQLSLAILMDIMLEMLAAGEIDLLRS